MELAEIFLEKGGYDVVVAYDGKEGLKKVEEEDPDLVLLDVMMPGINGWEVQRRVQVTSPKTKVCFLSGAEHLPNLEGIGASDYIVKRRPFTKKWLVSKVQSILEE